MNKELISLAPGDRVFKELNHYTNARVAIGNSGGHMLTKTWLDFQLDFAAAKDAIVKCVDLEHLTQLIETTLDSKPKTYIAKSLVNSLDEFLTRPDLGRSLHAESKNELSLLIDKYPYYYQQDILVVISTGLSSLAIDNHAILLLKELLPLLSTHNWLVAPIILSTHTRVAFADKINEIFKAKILVNLIGERPGLSSNDSMSIYFTYNSQGNTTDDGRNCISNINRNGISYKLASQKLVYLIDKSFKLGYSGVNLKDDFINLRKRIDE